jgi:Arc/MetJ family transcription regulator
VYGGVVSRTNIDIDDDALAEVMERFGFETKREAVNYALRALRVEPLSRQEILDMRGIGWEGDLDQMRGRSRAAVEAP